LSYKVLQAKSVRPLIDFGTAVPEHLSGVWIASDKLIDEKPAVIQKINNALFGAMAWLQDKANRQAAIKIIAEIDELEPAIAEAELDGNIMHLSSTGEMKLEWVQRGLDMAKLVGMKDIASIDQIYTTKFKAVPTR
ncbi:MAG: ABC transporter substrate-binding protein, partial [Pseudolabrys sp.]|nr:ABC transporter substrate-binding protein [Pseudolabrys sp.]